MVFAVITVLYFLVFLRILNLVLSKLVWNFLLSGILWGAGVIAALILSVVLADITEKKLRAHYKNSDV